jgi:hypothetical protein
MVTAAPSPERERLRRAIRERDALERDMARLAAARSAASERLAERRTALERARAAVTRSSKAAADYAIASLASGNHGGMVTAPRDAEDARQAQRIAEDALAAAQATAAEIERRSDEAARMLPLVQLAVRDAVQATVWVETPAVRASLAAEIATLQAEFLDVSRTLALLMSCGPRPMPDGEDAAVSAAHQEGIAPFRWRVASVPAPTEAVWRMAREGLLANADAPLPGCANGNGTNGKPPARS